jgi:hypothetical protein
MSLREHFAAAALQDDSTGVAIEAARAEGAASNGRTKSVGSAGDRWVATGGAEYSA